MHQCILCIGSNYRAETYMGMAEMLLNQRFPSIRWGKTVKTLPEGTTCPTPYLNRAARLDTNWDADTLRHYFKSIEKACGRTSLSKQTGIIPLDIDLLMIDNTVLKSEDMQKHPKTCKSIMSVRRWKGWKKNRTGKHRAKYHCFYGG